MQPGGKATFVLSAGISGTPLPRVNFHVFIDGSQRFAFHPAGTDSWKVKASGGGELAFNGILKDQYGDHFGYILLTVPEAWLRPGQAATIRITADKAPEAAWIMVYQDGSVIDYLKGKVAYEAYGMMTVEKPGPDATITISGASTWAGREVRIRAGSGSEKSAKLTLAGGKASARIEAAIMPDQPLAAWLDGEELFRIGSLAEKIDDSRITPKKMIQRTSTLSAGIWRLDYRSTFLPDFGNALTDLSAAMKGNERGFIISSSHQDIAWMDTPEQCIKDRDEKIITPALALIKENPSYRFDLEDVLELREFIGRHPDRKAEVGKYIAEGRLGIGASYNMPYEDLTSGEMLVRQFYAGKRWLRANFPGSDASVYWNPDVPGRAGQMPQIMTKAGVPSLVLSRQEKGLYTWKSWDSSSITVFSPAHYALFIERSLGKPFPEAAGYLASFSRDWATGIPNGSSAIPVLSMSDMSAPINYDAFMHTWNSLASITSESGKEVALKVPQLQYATAAEWLAQVAREKRSFPVVRGERPNIWLYIHGPTHHRAIDAKREADTYLTAAETFSTIDALLDRSFAHYPAARLTEAWEAQIYPDHGWGGKNGDVTDSTFLGKYTFARDAARGIYDEATARIARKIGKDAKGGIPLVVFNRLGWKRSGPVTCTVTAARGQLKHGLALRGQGGIEVPVQILSLERHPDGSIRSAEIVFIAMNVPSVGYARYTVVPGKANQASAATGAAPAVLENPYYRVALAPGGIRQITDVMLKRDLFAASKFQGAELFTMQSIGEDAGEWADPQYPTLEGFDQVGSHAPAWQLVEQGPIRQVVELRQPIEHVTVVQRITLYRNLKQVDLETKLLGFDGTHYREFRLAFPVNVRKPVLSYEAPFETVEIGRDEMRGAPGERYTSPAPGVRPRAIQNWIDASDDGIGVTFSSSVSVWDYKNPTDSTDASTFLQPILLASRKSCNWEGNWYPQGGDHDFRFSLTSHQPGWRNGRRFGTEANTPLTAVVGEAGPARGGLPSLKSFLAIDADNVVFSTLKKAEEGDDLVLRVYEADRKSTTAKVALPVEARGVVSTNIIEDPGTDLGQGGSTVALKVGHQAIETYRIRVK
jgi:alpha-mannosidase